MVLNCISNGIRILLSVETISGKQYKNKIKIDNFKRTSVRIVNDCRRRRWLCVCVCL